MIIEETEKTIDKYHENVSNKCRVDHRQAQVSSTIHCNYLQQNLEIIQSLFLYQPY
jgi:hypothetical protein